MLRRLTQTSVSLLSIRIPVITRFTLSRNMADNLPKVVQFDFLKGNILSKNKTLIDVREPNELKEDGKIPNSINIPLGDIEKAFNLSDTAFQEKYGISKPSLVSNFILSCRSGKRATVAFEKLKPFGYENISIYKGSFLDWVEQGGPIEK